MEQLSRLQNQISSLRDLRDLIRAMRALAASHVQEAQISLLGIRKYVEVVEDSIAQSAALLSEIKAPLEQVDLPQTNVLIAICSEHGFVGSFNEKVLDRIEAERQERQDLLIIGRRGATLAQDRGMEVSWSVPMATHMGGVLTVTRLVAARLTDVVAADVVFAGYRKGGNFDVEAKSILPLDPGLLTGSHRRRPPLHHISPDVLLQRLSNEYFIGEITRAITESLASENGSRLRAMETSDHNIGDKLDRLRQREHTLRQAAITSELLDVVTGSQAILNG